MEELNDQLWEVIKSQEKTIAGDWRYPKFNQTSDLSNKLSVFKNITTWEELQSIILFHYNRSLHLHSKQQRSVDQDCHPFEDIFNAIHSYYLPSMIFLGLVGNLLSCIVFLNTHLRMRSSSYYLAALACADFGFLASLFLVWLNGTLEIPVFNLEGYCQCIVYVSSVCSFLSVWFIVAFTVERFIAVQYPLHRPQMCTVARAKAIVFYLVCISLAVHTYVFVTSGIIKLEDGSQVCEMLESQREAMRVINIIDSVLTLIAPLILIVVMNSMIIYNLVKFRKTFKKQGQELKVFKGREVNINFEPIGYTTKCNSISGCKKKNFQSVSTCSRSNSIRRLSQINVQTKIDDVIKDSTFKDNLQKEVRWTKINCNKLKSTRSQQSITKMLLLISSVFILLNLPSYGIRLYVFVFFSIWAESPPVLLWCLQQIFMILYYTNFSINFLLYSMCGITFRRCLWQLVKKKLKKISSYQCRKSGAHKAS